ncbi:COX15/CtaA family protein [Nocardioides panacisoli]|uniref:COX15/CtaA family protein n=1 Tax=Nocardioides panacisoli TaxID=627624 RepID=A0ABP7J2P7_9ACTN
MTAVLDRTQRATERYARIAAWASLVVNMLIVVTGGLVRLTGSGLGCPTWPECQSGSLVPHGDLTIHKAIEFSNRMVTPLITIVVVATLVATWRMAQRRYALWILGGVVAQAVLGGITVRIKLNPWIVSAHLMLSMVMIAAAVALVVSLYHRLEKPELLGWAQFVTAFVVLALGTVVTGAGPHAGDADVKRNGLSALQTAQLHTDAVFLLVGLATALAVLRRSRATYALLAALVVNAAIGFTQYFTHLPVGLVAAHMLGATLVAATSTWALLEPREFRVRATDPA